MNRVKTMQFACLQCHSFITAVFVCMLRLLIYLRTLRVSDAKVDMHARTSSHCEIRFNGETVDLNSNIT